MVSCSLQDPSTGISGWLTPRGSPGRRRSPVVVWVAVLIAAIAALGPVDAFVAPPTAHSAPSVVLRASSPDEDHCRPGDVEVAYLGGDATAAAAADDAADWWRALEDRKRALAEGVGKRYVCCTTRGFLNVHYEPTDPFDANNVVGRLAEGQIVTSTGPTRGFWVPHDGGGWSISRHGGFTWLEPIDE